MEEILDPEIPICDSHHHLWDHQLPWMAKLGMTGHYMLEEFRSDKDTGHRIVNSVYVECQSGYITDGPEALRPVGETTFVVNTDPESSIGGIVGYADLRSPEIRDVLAAHVEAGNGRFRGIRNASSSDPSPDIAPTTNAPPGLLGDPSFRSGFAALGDAGLTFDAWLYHPQIGELIDLAHAYPGVPIVLDHMGGPIGIGPYRDRREEVLDVWRPAIRLLAQCPNVMIKLGGIGMTVFGMDWHLRSPGATSDELVAAWATEIRWCIEHFGVERCMFESNFPADKPSCSYAVLWNAYKRIVIDASSFEKAALFHDTASKFYGL